MIQPTERPADRRDVVRRCSAAATPRCAALIRSAASFDTIVVGARSDCPRAAPMMRLSAQRRVEPVLEEAGASGSR